MNNESINVTPNAYRQMVSDNGVYSFGALTQRDLFLSEDFIATLPKTTALLSSANVYETTADNGLGESFSVILLFWECKDRNVLMRLALPPPATVPSKHVLGSEGLSQFWQVFGGFKGIFGDHIQLVSSLRSCFTYPARTLDANLRQAWLEVLEQVHFDVDVNSAAFLDKLRIIGQLDVHRVAYRIDSGKVLLLSDFNDNPLRQFGLDGKSVYGTSAVYSIDGVDGVTDFIELVSRLTLDRIAGYRRVAGA